MVMTLMLNTLMNKRYMVGSALFYHCQVPSYHKQPILSSWSLSPHRPNFPKGVTLIYPVRRFPICPCHPFSFKAASCILVWLASCSEVVIWGWCVTNECALCYGLLPGSIPCHCRMLPAPPFSVHLGLIEESHSSHNPLQLAATL